MTTDHPGFAFVQSALLSKQTTSANVLGVHFLGAVSLQRVPTSTAENARVRLGKHTVRSLADDDAAAALADFLCDLTSSMRARADAADEAVTVARRLLADAHEVARLVDDDSLELIDGHRERATQLLAGHDVPDLPELPRVAAARALPPGDAPLLAHGTVAAALASLDEARGRHAVALQELRQIPAVLDAAHARAVEAHGNALQNLAARATAAENRPDLTRQLATIARKARALSAALDEIVAAATAATPAQESTP